MHRTGLASSFFSWKKLLFPLGGSIEQSFLQFLKLAVDIIAISFATI